MIARCLQAVLHRHVLAFLVLFFAGLCFALPGRAQGPQTREYPPNEYYVSFRIFDDGDFADAARAFRQVRKDVRGRERA